MSADKGLEGIADRYKNMITQQFKRRVEDLDKELIFSTEYVYSRPVDYLRYGKNINY